MAAAAGPLAQPTMPALDPGPFAPIASLRLALLALAVAAAASGLGLSAFGMRLADYGPLRNCVDAALAPMLDMAGPLTRQVEADVGAEARAAVSQVVACFDAAAGGALLWWPAGFLAATALVTAALYALDGRWTLRRRGVEPAPPLVAAAIGPRVEALMARMGLRRPPPALWWTPLPHPLGPAFVFGSDRRPNLAVSLDLVARAAEGDPLADAVLAHELAHVANRDVTQARATRALFLGFVLACGPLTALDALLAPADPGGGGLSAAFGPARFAALAALLFLGRAAVLRARERLADLRAGVVPGVRDALAAHFAAERAGPPPPLLDRLLPLHPPLAARLRGLGSTADIFAPPVSDAAAYGFALGPICMVGMLFGPPLLVAVGTDASAWSLAAAMFGPVAPGAALFAAAVAAAAWRAAYAEALGAGAPGAPARVAAGATLGILLGLFGSVFGGAYFAGVGAVPIAGRAFDGPGLGGVLGGAAALFLVLFALFALIGRAARAWAPRLALRANGRRGLWPAIAVAATPMVAMLPIAVIVIGLATPAMVLFGDAGSPDGRAGLALAAFGLVLFNPLAPLALAAVAFGPLCAAVARPQPGPAAWPALSGPFEPPTPTPLAPLRAAAAGLVWGVVALALLRGGLAPLGDAVGMAAILRVALLLAPAATLAALSAPALRFEHGLAGYAAAALPFGAALALLGEAPWMTLWMIGLCGLPVAAPAALIGAGLAGLTARARRAARRLRAAPP